MASQATLDRLCAEFDSPPEHIAAAVELLEQNATPAYLARHRRAALGNLPEDRLGALAERLSLLNELEQRRATILEQAAERGRRTEELERTLAATADQDLLDELGIPAGGLHPHLPVTDEDEAWVDEHLERRGVPADQKLLLLVVGANYGASKLWMPERFAAISRHFQDKHGMRALVLVGPEEIPLGERIAEEGGALPMTTPVLPLNALRALIRRGSLMITGDTGPRHMANAFDLPVVCMMGPNDPNYTNYCLEHTALLRKDLECMPCQRKVCPLGHQRCMRDITVEEVAAAGEGLLGLVT